MNKTTKQQRQEFLKKYKVVSFYELGVWLDYYRNLTGQDADYGLVMREHPSQQHALDWLKKYSINDLCHAHII